MNKTLAYSGVVSIVLIGLIGVLFLTAIDKDAGAFITLFSTTLPVAITAAVTFYQLGKVQDQAAKISKSVNGNTSTLLSLIHREALTPDEAEIVARIENDNETLITNKKGEHVA